MWIVLYYLLVCVHGGGGVHGKIINVSTDARTHALVRSAHCVFERTNTKQTYKALKSYCEKRIKVRVDKVTWAHLYVACC